MQLDGTCSALKTQIPSGAVTDWAFDAVTKQLYATLATTTSGSLIYTLDIDSGDVIDKQTVSGTLVPNTLEFAYMA